MRRGKRRDFVNFQPKDRGKAEVALKRILNIPANGTKNVYISQSMRLSNVAFGDVKGRERSIVEIRYATGTGREVRANIGALIPGKIEQFTVDLVLDGPKNYVFSAKGGASYGDILIVGFKLYFFRPTRSNSRALIRNGSGMSLVMDYQASASSSGTATSNRTVAAASSTKTGKRGRASESDVPNKKIKEEIADDTLDPAGDAEDEFVSAPSGMAWWNREVGKGEVAEEGSLVEVFFVLSVISPEDPKKKTNVRQSLSPKQPLPSLIGVKFAFVVGTSNVIEGLNLGVKGMHRGGERHLTIPPALAFGAAGLDATAELYGDASGILPIPPNSSVYMNVTAPMSRSTMPIPSSPAAPRIPILGVQAPTLDNIQQLATPSSPQDADPRWLTHAITSRSLYTLSFPFPSQYATQLPPIVFIFYESEHFLSAQYPIPLRWFSEDVLASGVHAKDSESDSLGFERTTTHQRFTTPFPGETEPRPTSPAQIEPLGRLVTPALSEAKYSPEFDGEVHGSSSLCSQAFKGTVERHDTIKAAQGKGNIRN
ncbi:hypothetical protein PLEOSDRAFT_1087260 [Pleurotus ostreatus PC15]|uniref:peptidylprolyl isomerase n=1 Tax=Pleurotus ostreatus (strain PC15) TaxID=1137138 RepID=A0A067NG22_PLEO1|nr:hypothetical protein PLEOSDRAFT_1087260 [Pleurotus ostreatus PC15]